jgi:hypothetical protein
MQAPDAFVARIFLLVQIAAATLGISLAGCAPLRQNNISGDVLPENAAGNGVIVGSVSAPPVYFHEAAYFYFRRDNNNVGQEGVMTSAIPDSFITPWLPECDADGLGDQCGRLFALELPAGRYEIYRSRFDRSVVNWEKPVFFEVLAGTVSYIGNIHVSYCEGMPVKTRGAILGADIAITDQSERDLSLLRARFNALRSRGIESQVLPDPAWQYRVPYTPHDWGSCLPD